MREECPVLVTCGGRVGGAMRRVEVIVIAATAAAITMAAASCGSGGTAPGSSAPSATAGHSASSPAQASTALPRIHLPVKKGETVEGLVDVNGHDIYARCSGTGSPTVVYFTGWAPDPSKLGVNVIRAIEAVDGGKHRICSYERRTQGVARR
jgi:hypothetical protein